MNTLDKQYQELLQDILDTGVTKSDRTGTGTLSVFGRQIRHRMSGGFPLLTTKRISFKLIVTELLWFLRGDTNIKYLVDNDCNIWTGDAYKNYLSKINNGRIYPNSFTQEEFINKIKTDDEFAKTWGELGPIYGKQWRSWNTNAISRRSSGTLNEDGIVENMTFIEDSPIQIDQIQNLINDLKTNPDSRRLMVTAWNPADLESSVLPPCHYGFQVYTRELSELERMELGKQKGLWKEFQFGNVHPECDKINIPRRAISLMFNMRSNDVPLGLPFNLASYGLLLEILAKEVNMFPDELIANLGDAHIYVNQIEGVKEQLTRKPYQLPKLVINDEFWNHDASLIGQINYIEITDFGISDYQSHPTIKIPLSN